VIRRFAQILLEDGHCTWKKVKEQTDEYAKRIRKRPRGNPVKYRYRITEALETKLSDPNRTWSEIADELDIDHENLVRQIRLLKELLRREGIPIPSTT